MPPATGRASVLSTDTDTPPVTKTAVSTNLFHTFDIITELGVEVLCENLRVFSALEILLPVEEPKRNFELTGILDNCYKFFNLVSRQLSSAFVDIDFGLLADQVCKTTSKTLDFCEAEDDVPLALNVGVDNTQDVLKLGTLHQR
mmetsp:Transcript_7643/g.21804  ORF Transcript_7643/g.21804 Transcript_7643/m.21804 type:complete len:144 (-) Transcript_7643:21-452(-)